MAEPSVTHRAVHNSGGGNLPVNRVVIHATCGGRGYPRESAAGVAWATAMYFQKQSSGGSAHYVCDVAGEEHCLPDNVVAWHAPPNSHSLGIEICADGGDKFKGFVPYTREQWLSDKVKPALERAARRTRDLCERHNVPLTKLSASNLRSGHRGICGHADVSAAFRQSDHTDPGPSFPWDVFMDLVQGTTDRPSPTPSKAPAWPGRYLKLTSPMMHGDDVKKWQGQMHRRGHSIDVDGWFGEHTDQVCRSFQRAQKLAVDGVIGPQTWRAAWEAKVT